MNPAPRLEYTTNFLNLRTRAESNYDAAGREDDDLKYTPHSPHARMIRAIYIGEAMNFQTSLN